MQIRTRFQIGSIALAAALIGCAVEAQDEQALENAEAAESSSAELRRGRAANRAKNVILFIGDGMGVSTVSATRVFSVGVDGNLVMDQLPYSALSRTADADHITPDSASTMTSMMTGVNTNSGVIGFGPETEFGDFNGDGDGVALTTLLERAKRAGMRAGVVSTARVTHATPAACYSHINNRDNEQAIALQALPGDSTYNRALGSGLDLMLGGGRQFFVPSTVTDEEGGTGSRSDGRDLRAEFQSAGYSYVWNATGLASATKRNLPLLGLFERGHMEYEHDRPTDAGGEPSLSELTLKSIELLSDATRHSRRGFFLMVVWCRIEHAHPAGNAWRALTDAEELDRAIGRALSAVDLRETLILVTADH
ncbi:MAG TPA: alkaline phosphatase, partial [Polyangiaceae bacterium]|nr:alkaline phosphatase [Polyangiaceae bacterium]